MIILLYFLCTLMLAFDSLIIKLFWDILISGVFHTPHIPFVSVLGLLLLSTFYFNARTFGFDFRNMNDLTSIFKEVRYHIYTNTILLAVVAVLKFWV